MSIWHLVFREIAHRKLNFLLCVLSIGVAAACLTASSTLLRAHDARTTQLVAAKEEETKKQMDKLEDDYRKITIKLGFNVLILPKDQNLADLYASDYASKYMPEDYAKRLAASGVVTVNHLLPMLQEKVKWPERERTIILVGTRGEVPKNFADPRKPMLDPVLAGSIILGYELHKSLKLNKGDKIELMGRSFTVGECYAERGTKDDITAWVNLKEAQQLLGKEGQINGILALECVCAADSLAKVRAEIARILPDTQVIEYASQVLARAEARQRASVAAEESIAAEKAQRLRLRNESEGFAALLVPIVMAACSVWVAFLALANVRERRNEIGILRAIGMRSRQISSAFLGKAFLFGLAGGVAGWGAGFAVGLAWSKSIPPASLFDAKLLAACIVVSPLLSLLASWIPATLAAQQQPADILREE